ncbi:sister chromatid cohesion 1 protein 2-like isoform X2 [Aristolochia californica]|uniref:sister chromatid cohesion 1 protein 2-like isoform X2 n=1 Tax=Aristolochia californica TaxID=171875 RepID=UPI0035D6D1AB
MQKPIGKASTEVGMFYSELLSKNGPLGAIWLAAHFSRKLRKHLVAETDICASIDNILLAEVPVAYRVLGYLLIGVVRIYARKVEYLYHDCNEALIKVKDSVTSAKTLLCKEASAPFMSITLPESFELDAFDLGDWEDDTSNRLIEQTTHGEMFMDEKNLSSSACKLTCSWERPVTHPEMLSRETRAEEMLLPNATDAGLKNCGFNKLHDLDVTVEKFRGHQGTCLDLFSSTAGTLEIYQKFEDFDSPLNMVEALSSDLWKPSDPLIGDSDEMRDLGTNNEVLQGNPLPQEDSLNLDLICSAGEASGLQYPNEQKNHVGMIKVLEVVPLDVGKSVVPQVRSPASTPKSNFPYTSVISTPEFMAIHTPKRKEQTPMQQRRKRSFDETIVLSNLSMRQGLHDTSSLVRRRKLAPHTSRDFWLNHVTSILHHDFLEPLNPYIALELKALFARENFNHWSSIKFKMESALSNDWECRTPIDSSHEKALSPKEVSIDEMDPTCLEISETCREVRIEASIASQGEEEPAIESPDINLMDEEMSSCEFCQNKDGWSVRTSGTVFI